jgi:hypothetical protein
MGGLFVFGVVAIGGESGSLPRMRLGFGLTGVGWVLTMSVGWFCWDA